MKTTLFTLFGAVLLGLVSGCAGLAQKQAAALAAAQAKVEVEFISPENFTDVKDGQLSTEKGSAATLDELHKYLVDRAARHVPEGQRLKIAVRDIDMAGDYEPWRRADIRIVKGIYPPSIDLEFTLVDASGAVLKQGERRLHDLAFQLKVDTRQNDRLRHEKALLDDWLSNEFGATRGQRGLAATH